MLGDEERDLVRDLVVEYAPMGDDFNTVFDFIKEDVTDPDTLAMTKSSGKYKGRPIVDILDRQRDYAYIIWVNIQKITNPEWGMRPYL